MQTTNPDQTVFTEAADTFHLTVALADHGITLILKDYVDWAIYSKQYTEEDVGKEIHKKMDLADIYTAFTQSRTSSGEEEDIK